MILEYQGDDGIFSMTMRFFDDFSKISSGRDSDEDGRAWCCGVFW